MCFDEMYSRPREFRFSMNKVTYDETLECFCSTHNFYVSQDFSCNLLTLTMHPMFKSYYIVLMYLYPCWNSIGHC